MCGIVGFIDPEGRTPAPERALRAMREALTHRGPDDAGELFEGPAFLGHRRLSIVDVSEAGRQPFALRGADGALEVAALANGEIYNHRALRPRIQAAFPGARVPPSDCAILPWMWNLEGEALPTVLSGMLALAVWDARRGRLLLSRDPAGQKPLYWATLPGGGLAFASEPKALLLHPLVARDVDPVGLRRFLAFDFIPGEASIYRQIRHLPPGGRLVWEAGRVRTDVHFPVPAGAPALEDHAEASAALWTALGDAVERRLMSDVPLGLFLSGGLDTTAVMAALAERVDPATVATFSVGFDDPRFDESPHARAVARHFGTRHHEEQLTAAGLLDLVPRILETMDEPFADPSIVPTWLLSEFTRRHVTVALGGDGGDELLLGYPTFYAERVARLADRLPAPIRRRVVEPLVGALPASTGYMGLDFKLQRFVAGLGLPPHHRHPVWVGGVAPAGHAAALAPGLLAQAPDEAVFADQDAWIARFDAARPDAHALERLAWGYLGTYLADGVLAKVDRASMAHALEVRAPMLDRQVLAVCARIPTRFKLRGRTTKAILRELLADRVPADVVARGKQGFGIPVAAWLRGPLQGWLRSVLAPERVAAGGLLDPAWTARLVEEHVAGARNHRKELWSALALELWRTGPWGPDRGEGT